MKITEIPNLGQPPGTASMMNGNPVQGGRDPDSTKPYKQNNLVAKHAHINKGGAHPSKKDYNRKTKHKNQDTDVY